MASSLSKVSGGACNSASASTSASSVTGLPPDSYEEQLQRQKQHLTSRHCYQIFINVLGARNIPPISRGTGFYVTLEGMTNCSGFKLETPTVEKAEDLRWPGDYRMLHFEASTRGLHLELTYTRSRGRDQSLGRASILFQDLLQQPEFSVEAWFPLELQLREKKKKKKNSTPPELLVKARIEPALPSPFLLRAVQGHFQNDNLETIVQKKGPTPESGELAKFFLSNFVPSPFHVREDFLKDNRETAVPEGRWSTRSMVDHNSKEKYLVRVRRAKPKKRYLKQWNAPVEEWEKELCIFQQSVRLDALGRKKFSVQANSVAGWAQHQIATHSFKKSSHVERQWSLFGNEDIVFKVQRDGNNIQWMKNLHFELSGKGFGYPVELCTGRHLQYEVPLGKQQDYESGYVTVIRKSQEFPTGKATALFNWKAIAVEVSPEENVTMVMLMAVVTALVVQDWYEETANINIRPGETEKNKVNNSRANENSLWGVVSIDDNNSMALSALLWKFKKCPYSNIDANTYRNKLKTTMQSKWSPEMFELFYDTFGGGGKINDVGGFEGGYIGLYKDKLGYTEGDEDEGDGED